MSRHGNPQGDPIRSSHSSPGYCGHSWAHPPIGLLPPGSQVNYGTPGRRRGSGLGFFICTNASGLGRQDSGVCLIWRGLYGRPHGPRSGGCRVRVLHWRSMSAELAWRRQVCGGQVDPGTFGADGGLMCTAPPPPTAGTRSGHCGLLLCHDGCGSCDGT